MSPRAPLALVSRRVVDSAVIFGVFAATAIATVIMVGLWVAVARLSRPQGEAIRSAASPSSPIPGAEVAGGDPRP